MKKIYLDTTIYNKLLDFVNERKIGIKKLSQKIISNDCVVLFNGITSVEIGLAADKCPSRAAGLFKLSYEVCSKDHIIKQIPDLIRGDLRCFLKDNREDSPFVRGEERQIFISKWEKSTNPKAFKNMSQNTFRQLQNGKKNFLTFYKQSKEKLRPLWEPYQKVDFRKFYQRVLQSEEGGKFIENICIGYLGGKDGNSVYQKLNLTVLRHLRFALKADWGLIYLQLVKNKKPKWGDNMDIRHITLSSVANIFVTDDEDLQKLFDTLEEKNPKCINFEKFKKLLKFK